MCVCEREMTESKKVNWIHHYNSEQKILLVGEGDFSFSACLAKALGSGANMVATSVLSQGELERRHRGSVDHCEKLDKLGCMVLNEVDVHTMNNHHTLRYMKFDVVVFNFPHAGHIHGCSEHHNFMIRRHKKLLKEFYQNAKELLLEGGEVHVTHRDGYPYNTWGVKELAENVGFYMKEKVFFEKKRYQGYLSKRGGGINGNKKYSTVNSFTYKFSFKPAFVQNNKDYEIEQMAEWIEELMARKKTKGRSRNSMGF